MNLSHEQVGKISTRKSPYSNPQNMNIQICPEPRHYGQKTGKYEQIELDWLDPEPDNQRTQNNELYALSELHHGLHEEE